MNLRLETNGVRSVPFSKARVGTAAKCVAAVLLVFLASRPAAQAHPGHDLFDHGALHLAASPFHTLTLFGAGLGLMLGARLMHSTRTRAVLHLGATLCILAAAACVMCR